MASKKRFNDYKIVNDIVIMYVKRKEQTLEVKFDLEDLDKIINIGSWHAIEDKTLQETSYYIANRYNNKKLGKGVIKLHRLITNCPQNMIVDHINHDTLDNRKQNLKVCTRFENQQNLRSCKSGITGVYQKKDGKWVANITKNKKRYYKEVRTKEEAIKWRKEMINTLYKEVIL